MTNTAEIMPAQTESRVRRATAVVVTVCALALVSACGASGGDDEASGSTTTVESTTSTTKPETTTTTEPDDQPVEDWADSFCGSFGDWLDNIKAQSADVQSSQQAGDVPGAKAAIVGLFDGVSQETESLIDDLKTEPVPDIDRGDEFVDDLVTKFEAFDDAIVDAKTKSEALPVDDPAAFAAEVKTLVGTFQTETQAIGDSFGELDTKYQSADLNTALSKSCDL